VACDAIRGGDPLGSGHSQSVPVYACNPDFLFAGAYPVPRFAAGSFTTCLRHLFHLLTGSELVVKEYGKPLKVTYDYALQTLNLWRATAGAGAGAGTGAGAAEVTAAAVAGLRPLRRVFMVGDNPKADIRGANAAGDPWTSVLVQTGVFKPAPGQPNDPVDPAALVVPSIVEAVDAIIAADVALGRG
jgi:ribonucleotide monophosphatase NagD (HAD superfamily)